MFDFFIARLWKIFIDKRKLHSAIKHLKKLRWRRSSGFEKKKYLLQWEGGGI